MQEKKTITGSNTDIFVRTALLDIARHATAAPFRVGYAEVLEEWILRGESAPERRARFSGLQAAWSEHQDSCTSSRISRDITAPALLELAEPRAEFIWKGVS